MIDPITNTLEGTAITTGNTSIYKIIVLFILYFEDTNGIIKNRISKKNDDTMTKKKGNDKQRSTKHYRERIRMTWSIKRNVKLKGPGTNLFSFFLQKFLHEVCFIRIKVQVGKEGKYSWRHDISKNGIYTLFVTDPLVDDYSHTNYSRLRHLQVLFGHHILPVSVYMGY